MIGILVSRIEFPFSAFICSAAQHYTTLLAPLGRLRCVSGG